MEKIYIWIIALMVLSALVTIIKPRIKGKMGEATVSMLLKKLDKNKYQVVNEIHVQRRLIMWLFQFTVYFQLKPRIIKDRFMVRSLRQSGHRTFTVTNIHL